MNNFLKLIKKDLLVLIFVQWKKFIPLILIGIVTVMALTSQLKDTSKLTLSPSFIDYILYLYKGIEPFQVLSGNDIFKIPFIWLFFHLYVFYLIADYPVQDIKYLGKEIFIRMKKRWIWWFGKIVVLIFLVVFSYLIFYLTILAGTIFLGGNVSMEPNKEVFDTLFHMSSSLLSAPEIIVLVIILPVFITICSGIFQLSIAIISKPNMSFLITVIILIISAYYLKPYLIGNYLMLLRNQLFLETGVENIGGFIVALLTGVVGYILGAIKVEKLDIY